MAEDASMPGDVGRRLDDVRESLESLQNRMLAGEEVDEKEFVMLARLVATQIEEIRTRLEESVGEIPRERIHEEMQRRLAPEDYQEWLKGEEERIAFREEVRKERALREQLELKEDHEDDR